MYPPHTLSYYKLCIQIEKSLPQRDIKRVRSLYDRCLSAPDKFAKQDDDIWIEYINWELNDNKEFKRASEIHWKAKKSLDNPTSFVAKCNGLLNGITSLQ